MTLEEKLCAYAQKKNTEIVEFPLPECGSMAVKSDGLCFIGIDPARFSDECERAVVMAHEIGHCETDSFYCIHAPLITRERLERRATVWAIEHLIPEKSLRAAHALGICEEWELAEYFGVTRAFVRAALRWYATHELYYCVGEVDEQ